MRHPGTTRAAPPPRPHRGLPTEQTVKTHAGRILAELGQRDQAQAAVFAYESGLVTPGAV